MTRAELAALSTGAPSPIAVKLRDLRRAQRMTQDQVAALVGVTRECISQWETGGREPGYIAIQRWAGAFGLRMVPEFRPLAEEAAGHPAPEAGA